MNYRHGSSCDADSLRAALAIRQYTEHSPSGSVSLLYCSLPLIRINVCIQFTAIYSDTSLKFTLVRVSSLCKVAKALGVPPGQTECLRYLYVALGIQPFLHRLPYRRVLFLSVRYPCLEKTLRI